MEKGEQGEKGEGRGGKRGLTTPKSDYLIFFEFL